MEDRKQRGIPKLRDLLRRQRRESEGQIDMAPDVDFVYDDTDQLKAETAELYSYTEEEEFRLNRQAFENECLKQGSERWTTMKEKEKRMYVSQVLDRIETVHPDLRISTARILLYLVQGNFGEVSSEEEQKEWSKQNVLLLYNMGAFPYLVQLLNVEIENSLAATSALHKPSVSMADSTNLRIYINIIYTITETMRIVDPEDSEDILEAKENFRIEIGQPIIGDDMLCIVLLEMIIKFCAGGSPHFPIKKILLLLWKTILVSLGGTEQLGKDRKEARVAAGLPPSFEDQCPSLPPILNNPTSQAPPPSPPLEREPLERESECSISNVEGGGQIVGAALKLAKPHKCRPKVRQKDVDVFLDNTRSKFVGFHLRRLFLLTSKVAKNAC